MTATASARARPADDRAPPDPAAARLVISLLGEVAVVVDGRPVPELAAPRMQRLWARLVLARGHRLLRNQLACELWPQSSDAQARTNLRKLLHDLRRSLPAEPELVDVDSRAVRWCAGSMVWVDVLAFTDALAKGELREAVGSYGGVLLPDCDDDIWVEAERERLRRLAVETLAGLAADADVEHRDSDVVGYARDLLRIDPLHEPGLSAADAGSGAARRAQRSAQDVRPSRGDARRRARPRAGACDDRAGRAATAPSLG